MSSLTYSWIFLVPDVHGIGHGEAMHMLVRLQQVHTNLSIGDLAFKMPHLYDYISKLCRAQAEVIISHGNAIDSAWAYWQSCTLCYSLLEYVTTL
jgi:hypothetical protein